MDSFIKSIRISLAVFVTIIFVYLLFVWVIGWLVSPNGGKPVTVKSNGRIAGIADVGQDFSEDIFFGGRPSCAGKNGYDATHSGGSNKSAGNEEYLRTVESRIELFLLHHPYLKKEQVPSEMVTASGSGLDPDISPEAASVQVKRVAAARGIDEPAVAELVEKYTEQPLLGLFGPAKINVLRLNCALDELTLK